MASRRLLMLSITGRRPVCAIARQKLIGLLILQSDQRVEG